MVLDEKILGSDLENMYDIERINNTGIIFERVATAQFYSKRIEIYTYIDLPSYDDDLKNIKRYIDEFEDICTTNGILTEKIKCNYVAGREEHCKQSMENVDLCWLRSRQEKQT